MAHKKASKQLKIPIKKVVKKTKKKTINKKDKPLIKKP